MESLLQSGGLWVRVLLGPKQQKGGRAGEGQEGEGEAGRRTGGRWRRKVMWLKRAGEDGVFARRGGEGGGGLHMRVRRERWGWGCERRGWGNWGLGKHTRVQLGESGEERVQSGGRWCTWVYVHVGGRKDVVPRGFTGMWGVWGWGCTCVHVHRGAQSGGVAHVHM